MTNILSSISGVFSKSLIQGTFLPVTVFVILFWLFVVPFFPASAALLAPLEALDPQWQVVAVLFLTIVLTGLLFNLNRPIIRFYEGYPWQNSLIGRWRTNYYKAQLRAAQVRSKGMRTLLNTIDENHEHYSKFLWEWTRVRSRSINELIGNDSLILPTRLGNEMRSFEKYSDRQYGMDAITLLPRLIAKVDKEYAAAIDDAKASFDFMINCSVLSSVLALTTLLVGLVNPISFASPRLWVPWLIEIVLFSSFTYLFYLGAIARVGARGALVKGAFDLYRWDLLKQLGYKHTPTQLKEERTLWRSISQQMLYGDNADGEPRIDYIPPPTQSPAVGAKPEEIAFEITRGVLPQHAYQSVEIVLQVKNNDSQRRAAREIVVTDTVPDDFDYVWGSARADGYAVQVIGTNPYAFHLDGTLTFSSTLLLRYRVIQRAPITSALVVRQAAVAQPGDGSGQAPPAPTSTSS